MKFSTWGSKKLKNRPFAIPIYISISTTCFPIGRVCPYPRHEFFSLLALLFPRSELFPFTLIDLLTFEAFSIRVNCSFLWLRRKKFRKSKNLVSRLFCLNFYFEFRAKLSPSIFKPKFLRIVFSVSSNSTELARKMPVAEAQWFRGCWKGFFEPANIPNLPKSISLTPFNLAATN